MLYTVNLDKESYILSVSHTDKDDTELDLESLETRFLDCYRLINGVAVLDEMKKTIEEAEDEKRRKTPSEIETLSAQVLYTAVMTDTLIEKEGE